MATQMRVPTLGVVAEDQNEAGDALRDRRMALGLSLSALHRRSGIDRGTIKRMEEGIEGTRGTTWGAVNRALSDLEHEMGMNDPESPGIVRFVVRGVFGADSLVVEGPVESIAELERSVDRIMRRLRDGDDT